MRTSLLILLLCATEIYASAQSPGNAKVPAACDAAFTVMPDPVDPMTIHLQDQSSGQITLWQWSFGDGATTIIQNPVHTYAAGGTYFICLTVSNPDPLYPCHDYHCVAITIHEPGTCVADYDYVADPLVPLTAHFSDRSSGNINGWHWDFGDGSSSYDPNPSHTFQSYGKFRICLTAYNIDSVSTCNDSKCDSLKFEPSADCHASFTGKLDSLNPEPNTFLFKNSSSGNPTKFLWKFDDGASYVTPDVTHHFQSPGLHEVCLFIEKKVQGNTVCIDSVCQTVSAEKYFNLGGHLFIGAMPINNPVATGDTGIACLFRVDGTRLVPVDTQRFTHLGYYTFLRKLHGTYIVRAFLTQGSQHCSEYFPGYFQQGMLWKEANSLILSDSNSYLADIRLTPVNDSLFGPGVIRGYVAMATPDSGPLMVPNASVMLFNAQLQPVRSALSGIAGEFELKNLPYGAYQLYVEYPGKYSRLTEVWLDSSKPLIDSLLLELFNHDVTYVQDKSSVSVVTGDLFPNPASDEVSMTIELARATTLKFEITTLTGLPVWTGSMHCAKGSSRVTIPLSGIRKGMYLFVIDEISGTHVAVKKLLKY